MSGRSPATAGAPAARLPSGVTLLERNWLSSNNLLVSDGAEAALIDSGYVTQAEQTVALVEHALGKASLTVLVNTHLHSDHCGGNAALQSRFPGLLTWVPPAQFAQVRNWDPVALTYVPTGQQCPRFRADGALTPGMTPRLGGQSWEVHAAPGHDPHSVILFEPRSRLLVSADALWNNGFGVVFPELDGEDAFKEVGDTLDLIESLQPRVVVPGHGPAFEDVDSALTRARARLASLAADPAKHARHGAKVLLKFHLLQQERHDRDEFLAWAMATPYLQTIRARWAPRVLATEWVLELLGELERAGAARVDGDWIRNA